MWVLPHYVARFMELHPGIDIRLNNVTGPDGLNLLRRGEVDFAVGPLLDIPDDIDFYPIKSYEPMLITALDHPLGGRKRITLKDISEYPLILPPSQLSTRRQVEQVFIKHELSCKVRLEVGGYDVIKEYVEYGLGISIVMSNCLKPSDQLFSTSVKRYFPKRVYGVVTRKGGIPSPQARSFIELMSPKLKGKL